VNCEAQDNNAHGFLIDSFARVQLIGCLADSNNAGHSAAADQSGNGIHIINSSRCIIEAHSRDRGANTRPQKYALGLASGAAELKARITGNGNTTGNLLGGFHSQIDVSINAYGGRQSVAYAASITPDPTQGNVISVGTLTGDITINEHRASKGLPAVPGGDKPVDVQYMVAMPSGEAASFAEDVGRIRGYRAKHKRRADTVDFAEESRAMILDGPFG